MEKAVILSDGYELTAGCLSLSRPLGEKAAEAQGSEPQTLEDMESRMIRQAIEQCGGNLSQVATRLGITRQTLYNKMKRYGI